MAARCGSYSSVMRIKLPDESVRFQQGFPRWTVSGVDRLRTRPVQGPKFRVGELAADPVELKNGDILEFGAMAPGSMGCWVVKGLSKERFE